MNLGAAQGKYQHQHYEEDDSPSNPPDRVAQTLQDHVHRSFLFFLAPTDRKAAFREDIADACDLPGLVLDPHCKPIVNIPTASKPIGISSRKRQCQDGEG